MALHERLVVFYVVLIFENMSQRVVAEEERNEKENLSRRGLYSCQTGALKKKYRCLPVLLGKRESTKRSMLENYVKR